MIPLRLIDILLHAKQHHGHHTIRTYFPPRFDTPVSFTYVQFADRVAQLAHYLSQFQFKSGDTIGTLCHNHHLHLEIAYATSCSGFVFHPINPKYTLDQNEFILTQANDRIVFYDESFSFLVNDLRSRCPSVEQWIPVTSLLDLSSFSSVFEWPCLDELTVSAICYTSGTTGNPKGVRYTARSLVLQSMTALLPGNYSLGKEDTLWPLCPIYHVLAWGYVFIAPLSGCNIVFTSSLQDPILLHRISESEHITYAAGVATFWKLFLNGLRSANRILSSIRQVHMSGLLVDRPLIQLFSHLGIPEIMVTWGMTEIIQGFLIRRITSDDTQPIEYQGKPVFSVQAKTVEDELYVKSLWSLQGYLGLPPLQEGWLPTGDNCQFENDHLVFLDRKKDILKYGGEWISTMVVENTCNQFPGVVSSACIGCPHSVWGEVPYVFIVVNDHSSDFISRLKQYLEKILPLYYVPDLSHFRIIEEIPRNGNGKIQKQQLKELVSIQKN